MKQALFAVHPGCVFPWLLFFQLKPLGYVCGITLGFHFCWSLCAYALLCYHFICYFSTMHCYQWMLFIPRSKLSGKGGHEVPYFLLWSWNLGTTRERDGTEQHKEALLCVCAGKALCGHSSPILLFKSSTFHKKISPLQTWKPLFVSYPVLLDFPCKVFQSLKTSRSLFKQVWLELWRWLEANAGLKHLLGGPAALLSPPGHTHITHSHRLAHIRKYLIHTQAHAHVSCSMSGVSTLQDEEIL